MECVFCKIVKKEIPAKIVYEDDVCIAFLDINPLFLAHTLVIPKKHVKSIFDIEEKDLEHVLKIAKKISLKIKEKLGVEGVNIFHASEEAAGQTIPHFHLHIVPRKKGDGLNLNEWWRSKIKKIEEKKMDEIVNLIKLEKKEMEEKEKERSEEEIYWIRREIELA